MKLYGSVKSERAEKGQGGNDFLEIRITNDKRQKIALIKVLPGEKIKLNIEAKKELVDVELGDSL